MTLGGFPAGTTTVGGLPKVPAGEGEATFAKCEGMVVAVDLTVVVGAAADVVVVVVGVELPEKRYAAEITMAIAKTPTKTERHMVRRRFASRCI